MRKKFGHETTHQFAKCNKQECGLYLQYKKQSNKDPAMPKELLERRRRCVEWISRPSPTCSPRASDNEEDETDAMEVGAVKGLEEEVVEYGI